MFILDHAVLLQCAAICQNNEWTLGSFGVLYTNFIEGGIKCATAISAYLLQLCCIYRAKGSKNCAASVWHNPCCVKSIGIHFGLVALVVLSIFVCYSSLYSFLSLLGFRKKQFATCDLCRTLYLCPGTLGTLTCSLPTGLAWGEVQKHVQGILIPRSNLESTLLSLSFGPGCSGNQVDNSPTAMPLC